MIENNRIRLRAFISEKGHSVASFEKSIGASNGSVALFMTGKNKGLGNNLEKILVCYPDLNAGWLISGKGSMLISEIDQSQLINENLELKQRLKLIESKNEIYTKPYKKGVRIESQKGGKDWRKNENQMYIKQEDRPDSRTEVSEPTIFYEKRDDLIEYFFSAQKRLFGDILARLDRLEASLPTTIPPPVENEEKTPI